MSKSMEPVIKTGSSERADSKKAVKELYDAIYQADVSFAVFYCSANYDLKALEEALAEKFADIPLIGCTTAGEIGPNGLSDDSLTGFTICSDKITVATTLISTDNFSSSNVSNACHKLNREREAVLPEARSSNKEWENFLFLICDGVSRMEERIVSTLYAEAFGTPIVGGSAGDHDRFVKTHVFYQGKFHESSSLISLVSTSLPFSVFKTENFVEKDGEKMVVTESNSSQRIVTEINGLPASEGYAEAFEIDEEDLSLGFYAAHPVAVKLGGNLFIRSITQATKKLTDDPPGRIQFACAIDTGIVLTTVEEVDMVSNLADCFEKVQEEIGEPILTLGFDCMLRKVRYKSRNIRDEIGKIMQRNHVVGFHTYGEQYSSLHVNQTFTAVAFGKGSAE